MTKNVFMQIVALVNGQTVEDMDALRDAINEEYNKDIAKREEKRAIYDEVKDIILNALEMQTQAISVSELYDEIKDLLPATFTKGKLQYALTYEIYPEIKKVRPTNSRGTYTYMRA